MHYDDNPNFVDLVRFRRAAVPKVPDYRGFRVLPGVYYDEYEDVYFQTTGIIDGLSVHAQRVYFDDTWTVVNLGPSRRFGWVEFCRELTTGRFVPMEPAGG